MTEREALSTVRALKLALDALEVCDQSNYGRNWVWPDTAHPTAMKNVREAITAIKEALMSGTDGAQPEYQSTADKSKLEKVPAKGTLLAQQCVCGEPNSAGTHRTDGFCLAPQPEHEWMRGECVKCGQSIERQEPVAWWRLAEDDGHQKYPIVSVEKPHPQWTTTRPLVFGDTSPPQRKPLTDEELFKLWDEDMSCDMPDTFTQFKHTARAIEAAHGIKENK